MCKVKTNNKPFLTYEQQVEKLVNEKGLIINDKEFAIRLLKNYSYFDLVSGYKRPFKNKDGQYKVNTTIEDLYALYCFDDNIRALFLKYILKIEKKIKSLISYSFCVTNGEEQTHYLNATKYNYNEKNQVDINRLISKLNNVINEPKEHPYIKHQIEKYQNVPLWVLMKALTLGTVSKMYSYLLPQNQCLVSKEFEYVSEGMLIQMLDILSRVRNVCAHNERLFDYKYIKGTIDDTDVHYIMNIPKKHGANYVKGKNDLFAIVIVMKYLLETEDFAEFIDTLDSYFNVLFSKTNNIQRTQLYKYMGFPTNWKEIKNCDKVVKVE